MITLSEIFQEHEGRRTHKYPHHIEIYDHFFSRFKGKEPVILEIGIAHGGSLELWRKYFGAQAQIIGIDVQDMTAMADEVNAKIFTGDQANRPFMRKILKSLPGLDIVIDDGSHRPKDQIVSFTEIFGYLNDGGLYAVEDLQTSYRENYGGGYKSECSFVEYLKQMIDGLHYSEEDVPRPEGCDSVFGIHAYPGLAIIEKRNPTSWGGSTMRPV